MEGLEGLIFKEKQTKIISLLGDPRKEWHLSDLAKESGTTYVHASRFVSKCEHAGLLGYEKHGRIKRIFLTEKGARIAVKIADIEKLAVSDETEQQSVHEQTIVE